MLFCHPLAKLANIVAEALVERRFYYVVVQFGHRFYLISPWFATQMFENAEIFFTTFVVQLCVSQLGQRIGQQSSSISHLFALLMAAANSNKALQIPENESEDIIVEGVKLIEKVYYFSNR